MRTIHENLRIATGVEDGESYLTVHQDGQVMTLFGSEEHIQRLAILFEQGAVRLKNDHHWLARSGIEHAVHSLAARFHVEVK